jgi:hypothetical protein
MKRILISILLLSFLGAAYYVFDKLVWDVDYSRDSRHFFCLENGHCYIVLGKYIGLSRPVSQSYITSPFTKGMTVIWPKNTNNVIVDLEDENKQIIHNSPNGIKIINYKVNKKHNDSIFLYRDGTYDVYKDNVEFLNINILEEYASGQGGKRLN